jgi:hypothetical protein
MWIRLHWRTGQACGARLRGTSTGTSTGHENKIRKRGTSTGHQNKYTNGARLRGIKTNTQTGHVYGAPKQNTQTGHVYGARKQNTNSGHVYGAPKQNTNSGHAHKARTGRSVLTLVFHLVFPSCSYSVLKSEFGFTVVQISMAIWIWAESSLVFPAMASVPGYILGKSTGQIFETN